MTTVLPLVAIWSPRWERYLSLNGTGITEYTPTPRGTVNGQSHLQSWERFYLEHHPDGTVSFRSSHFNNVYLTLDAGAVRVGDQRGNGGGYAKAQFGCLAWEKYRIKTLEGRRAVGIEAAAFPGRFLRYDGGKDVVNAQGVLKGWEEFEIFVVG